MNTEGKMLPTVEQMYLWVLEAPLVAWIVVFEQEQNGSWVKHDSA